MANMVVRLRLDRLDGSSKALRVLRRPTWLPPNVYRESLPNAEGYAWRDYRIDRHASADRGVLVYRQFSPPIEGA